MSGQHLALRVYPDDSHILVWIRTHQLCAVPLTFESPGHFDLQ